MYEVPSHPDNIVIEVCQDLSASKDDFIVNEIHTMLQAVFRMKYQGIPVKPSSIEVDTSNIWRRYTSMEIGIYHSMDCRLRKHRQNNQWITLSI